jgi:hypothetical protein
LAINASLRETYHYRIDRKVCSVIAEANAGRFPITDGEWTVAAARFRLRIKLVDPAEYETPHIRISDTDSAAGTVYLPAVRSWRRRQVWLIHEVGEWAMQWEGEPAFYYPAALGTHHDLAVMIEKRNKDHMI